MNQQFEYQTRKADLKDIMFFHQAICEISGVEIDINEFNIHFKLKLKDKFSIQLVLASEDKKIVGCIVAELRKNLSDQESFFEVQELYIAPKFRKYKAADYLYNELERIIAARKVNQLRVSCNINATLNQNFYVKKGFKVYKKLYKKMVS